MCTGGDFYNDKCSSSKNPVYAAYKDWLSQSKDIYPKTCWPARPSWDLMTVYAAVVGTQQAQMWEESGTDEIDQEGHENWDKGLTSNNEASLWFTNDDKKPIVTKILNDMLCQGNGGQDDGQDHQQEKSSISKWSFHKYFDFSSQKLFLH